MMDFKKVSREISNPISENVKKLAELFPAAVKDGQVDFEALKQELGQFEEVGKEKYELTWPGKTMAKQLANMDIVGRTLKYVPEDSKNPETTQNLYIEGDNLEVLKLLRNAYYGKIKMIYIDPPYNTGNDFIYKDDYSKLKLISDIEEGEVSETGERLIRNQKSSARFHSNWLNMMYPRLKLAKDLLSDDGVIFISIDEGEVYNLRMILNEIFREGNFLSEFIILQSSAINYGKIRVLNEYLLCYAKDISKIKDFEVELKEKKVITSRITKVDHRKFIIKFPKGLRYEGTDGIFKGFIGGDSEPIRIVNDCMIFKDGKLAKDVELEAEWSSPNVIFALLDGKEVEDKKGQKYVEIFFNKNGVPQYKKINVKETLTNVIKNIGDAKNGTLEIREIFGHDIMEHPKPVNFIKFLISIITKHDDIILDFFSGSATTAHAVMQLNAEDGGKRKFIMVQLPEVCDENSEAYKSGFKNISEIGKERIRRAGEKIKEEFKNKPGIENLDIGFKVFRVADTNIRWTSEAIKTGQMTLEESAMSNKDALDFNPGFTDIDVIYEIMLRHRGFPLTSKIEKLYHIGERTYIFADSVVVCLEEKITNEIIDKIAAIEPKPIKVIFRDSAFDDDISFKINAMNRLDVQLKKNNQGKETTYRVEFI
jgi:adenine-specific DNA-methyltransferase